MNTAMKILFVVFVWMSLWFLMFAAFVLAAPDMPRIGAQILGTAIGIVAAAITRKLL